MKTQEKLLEVLYSNVKGLSVRKLAINMGCDPRTAKKYLEHPELIGKQRKSSPHESLLDAYRDQIEAYLDDKYGNHRATWIYDQIIKSGFSGGYEIVKRAVRKIKGNKQRLAYVRFETIPGEQAQVDYGEFQIVLEDGTIKKYYLFAMILGYSRKLFACLQERCDLPSFLEAHILAFEYFGGVPGEILYDRMRNVYIRKVCDTPDPETPSLGAGRPLFTQSLMTLAVHYGFVPQVAPAYAPWVKGKIERPMDFIRGSWWHGYEFSNIETANQDLLVWFAQKDQRVHGTTHERIDVRFKRERPHLRSLPPARCDVSQRLTRWVKKDCTISVDGNRYIVQHTLVGRNLMVRLKDRHLRIFADADLMVEYDMPEVKGHLIGLENGFYEAMRADYAMQERKFGKRKKGKGRARIKKTISPALSKYPVDVIVDTPAYPLEIAGRAIALSHACDVECFEEPLLVNVPDVTVDKRSMDVYDRLGGEVCYAASAAEYWRPDYA